MALSLPIYFLGNTYVVHFRVQGKQIKRTLRTADPRIAKLRALKLMETARMAIKGVNPNVSDFDFSGKLANTSSTRRRAKWRLMAPSRTMTT